VVVRARQVLDRIEANSHVAVGLRPREEPEAPPTHLPQRRPQTPAAA
jgi:hypothetical protein